MREWCRRLKDPERCTLVSEGRRYYACRGSGSIAAPNAVMVGKLEDAGLIRWSDPRHDVERFAVLTKLGKANAA
jgi:hypothetical protein